MGGVEEGACSAEREDGASCVDVNAANAVRRLRKADEDGRGPAWAPGATGFLGNCLSEDDELRQLIEEVANAGSWVVWMGIFSRSWMEMVLVVPCW